MRLEIEGLGIVLLSASAAAAIPQGSDYLTTHYSDPKDVVRHLYAGNIVGFCTGSPGAYEIRVSEGYPAECELAELLCFPQTG